MMLHEIIVTQCAERAPLSLVTDSTNSLNNSLSVVSGRHLHKTNAWAVFRTTLRYVFSTLLILDVREAASAYKTH
jgi:hypothetical protein